MDKPTIIVVDDALAVLDLMEILLSDAGYHIIAVPRIEGLHHLIERARPALLIIDLYERQPPDVWRFVLDIQAEPATARLPMLVCSTSPSLLDQRSAMLRRFGIPSLEKPFDLEELLAMVAALVAMPRAGLPVTIVPDWGTR